MSSLSSLIALLEKAEEPSREDDAAICKAVEPEIWKKHKIRAGYPCGAPEHITEKRAVDFTDRYTSSIDAAVSLAERVLPGWTIASIGQDDRKAWHAELREGHRTAYSTVSLAGAPNGAIAIVLATLRALQQKGSSNG